MAPPDGSGPTGLGLEGGLQVVPTSLNFTDKCGSTPTPQKFAINNTGNAQITWKAALPDDSHFTLNGGPDSVITGTLLPNGAPNDGGVAVVTVAPKLYPDGPSAPFSDTITITGKDEFENVLVSQTVALSERPFGDQITVSPTALDFQSWPVTTAGTPSAAMLLTITNGANPGSADAKVSLSLSDSHFTIDEASPLTIPAGGNSVVHVRFVPGTTIDAAGLHSDQITLTVGGDDAQCAVVPNPVPVSGTSTLAQVQVSTNQLNFGTAGLVNCGASSAQQVTVTNTGNQAVTIQSLVLDNQNYAVDSAGLPMVIQPGGDPAVITVTGTVPGTMATVPNFANFAGTLTITTDAAPVPSNLNVFTVTLHMGAKGVIIDPAANKALTSTTWDFGPVNLGSSGIHSAVIWNLGNATADLTLGNSNTAFFLVGGTVGVGQDETTSLPTTITAVFTPVAGQANYSDSGVLTVAASAGQVFCQPLSNASTWDHPTITLSGSETTNPVITVSGSLSFPPAFCDGSAPAAQAITITNTGNSDQQFAVSLDGAGAQYYTADPPTSVMAYSFSGATVTVTPHLPSTGATFPGTNPALYTATLNLAGTTTHQVLISMPVQGAVLTSYLDTSSYAHATTSTGPMVTISNSGNLGATLGATFTGTNNNYFSLNPIPGLVAAGSGQSGQVRYSYTGFGSNTCQLVTLAFPDTNSGTDHVCVAPASVQVRGSNGNNGCNP